MSDQWEWQIRFNLSEDFAEVARTNPDDASLVPLLDVLARYDAVFKNQFDAFADYVTAAEASGDIDSVLYRWTKDLVDNPEKQQQYSARFSVYADGGLETYTKETADGLEKDLKALVESGMVTKVDKFDTNPANNPQAPKKFHKKD